MKKTQEDAVTQKTASLHLAVFGQVYQSIQVHGQFQTDKEVLRQLGYQWGDEMSGGLLAQFKKPKIALRKWKIVKDTDDIQATANQWSEELTELGYQITESPSPLDLATASAYFVYIAQKALEEQRAKRKTMKSSPKRKALIDKMYPEPKPPVWYADILDSQKYWNGRFYGNKNLGWRIYLDGEEIKVTLEEKKQYEKWKADLKDWKKFWDDNEI